MKINPYLNFNGQCEAAFKFYEQCLGAKIVVMMPHAGTLWRRMRRPNGAIKSSTPV
jgi:uncharacterized glyoxalase superfamily protein PhnB